MNLGESIQTCFSKYATFSGRASRSEFWWFSTTPFLLSLIDIILLFNNLMGLAIFLMFVGGLALFLPSLAVGVRRFHDTGRSGTLFIVLWFFSGLLIPFVFMLIFLLEDSQPNENRYGPNPKQNKFKQRNHHLKGQQSTSYQHDRSQNAMRSTEHNMRQRSEQAYGQEETLLSSPSPRLICGNRSYLLSIGKNIVGRSGETSEATVQIESKDRYMSRQHCCIDIKMRSDGQMIAVLSNYQNKNVMKVNGHQINEGDYVKLSDGNTITMGHTNVTFKDENIIEDGKQDGVTKAISDDYDPEVTNGFSGAFVFLILVGFLITGLICYALYSEKSEEKSEEKSNIESYETRTEDSSNRVKKLRFNMVLGSCIYTGEVDEDHVPHGQGEARFDDGRYYKGEWVHGEWTDFNDGYFQYSNGDTFEGTFNENKFFIGTYKVASDGSYYKGEFFNGKPDHGEWYDKNGNLIETIREN